MIGRRILGLVLLLGLGPAAPAQTPAAEEILAAHAKARGGLEAWRRVQSLRMTGQMDIGRGERAPFTLVQQRPRKSRLEYPFEGKTVVQIFDGEKGWMKRPWLGREGFEPWPERDLESAKADAGLDGPLLDAAAKGHRVEVLGREAVEGREAWKLRVTLSTGPVRHIWVDAATFLEIKTEGSRRLAAKDRPVTTFYRDYRTVEGLVMPFTLETKMEGAPASGTMNIGKVEVNPVLEAGLFAPPTGK